ncbi:unnamed protein product [Effrenium voratum]|nr:unnamed protein product [Effrenium voratum]
MQPMPGMMQSMQGPMDLQMQQMQMQQMQQQQMQQQALMQMQQTLPLPPPPSDAPPSDESNALVQALDQAAQAHADVPTPVPALPPPPPDEPPPAPEEAAQVAQAQQQPSAEPAQTEPTQAVPPAAQPELPPRQSQPLSQAQFSQPAMSQAQAQVRALALEARQAAQQAAAQEAVQQQAASQTPAAQQAPWQTTMPQQPEQTQTQPTAEPTQQASTAQTEPQVTQAVPQQAAQPEQAPPQLSQPSSQAQFAQPAMSQAQAQVRALALEAQQAAQQAAAHQAPAHQQAAVQQPAAQQAQAAQAPWQTTIPQPQPTAQPTHQASTQAEPQATQAVPQAVQPQQPSQPLPAAPQPVPPWQTAKPLEVPKEPPVPTDAVPALPAPEPVATDGEKAKDGEKKAAPWHQKPTLPPPPKAGGHWQPPAQEPAKGQLTGQQIDEVITKLQKAGVELDFVATQAVATLLPQQALELLHFVADNRAWLPNPSFFIAQSVSGGCVLPGVYAAAQSGGIDPVTMERLLLKAQQVGLALTNEALTALSGLSPEQAAELLEFVLEKSTELRDPSQYVVSIVARGYQPRRARFENERRWQRVLELGIQLDDPAKQALAKLSPEQADEMLEYIIEHHQHLRSPSNYIISTVARGFVPRPRKGGDKGRGNNPMGVNPNIMPADLTPLERRCLQINSHLAHGQRIDVPTYLALRCLPAWQAAEVLDGLEQRLAGPSEVGSVCSYLKTAVSTIGKHHESKLDEKRQRVS